MGASAQTHFWNGKIRPVGSDIASLHFAGDTDSHRSKVKGCFDMR